MDKNPAPIAMVLTHRHGGLVAFFSQDNFFTEDNFPPLNQRPYWTDADNLQFIQTKNFSVARILGKTAENLLPCYSLVSQKFFEMENNGSRAKDIKTLIYGCGPGSFTGLRLGAAFCNGLILQKNVRKIQIPTLLKDDLIKKYEDFEVQKELGETTTDESSGFLTYFDLHSAVKSIRLGLEKNVDEFLPHYGRDPKSVLQFSRPKT